MKKLFRSFFQSLFSILTHSLFSLFFLSILWFLIIVWWRVQFFLTFIKDIQCIFVELHEEYFFHLISNLIKEASKIFMAVIIV